VLDRLRDTIPSMLTDLETLVRSESPSHDVNALGRCSETLAAVGSHHVGPPERVPSREVTHLRWGGGERPVLVLGHYDTVWPIGTAARWPFAVHDGRATGPGVFDMKAGIVQGLHGLAMLGDLERVEVLITADEEIGSPTSRALVEEAARRARAVLVLEPSAGGALKVARKGGSMYRLEIKGRAAHAGLEPEQGVNALVEMSHQVLAVADLARPEVGTTVTPAVAASGTATNTVPASGTFSIDVRAADRAEQDRVDREIRGLRPRVEGAELKVVGGIDRPPLPRSSGADLFERAREIAASLGLGELEGAEVGGGSDGNFTAAVGAPTLDGLGAVGGGAHAEGEWVEIDRMPERAALVAVLVDELRRQD
jgi:glutamate carboxypeptidase